MKNFFDKMRKNLLFRDISLSEFEKAIKCLSPKIISFKKGEVVLLTGNRVDFVGMVLSGSVKVINESADGNIIINEILFPCELFAEALACVGVSQSPITVIAAEDSEIIFFDYAKIIRPCDNACSHHKKLIENMLYIIALKYIMQNEKISILSKRSIREKLTLFFNIQKTASASNKFTIPYNRDELAEYLCVNRSALSNELSKMQQDGLLKFCKNKFELFSLQIR